MRQLLFVLPPFPPLVFGSLPGARTALLLGGGGSGEGRPTAFIYPRYRCARTVPQRTYQCLRGCVILPRLQGECFAISLHLTALCLFHFGPRRRREFLIKGLVWLVKISREVSPRQVALLPAFVANGRR